MTDEAIANQLEMCIAYLEQMMALGLSKGKELGHKYLAITYDIVNNNGIVEPRYSQAYVDDLNDLFRMYKQGLLDITTVHIFEIETGNEVGFSKFRKDE